MFAFQSLIVDNLKAELRDVDDYTAITVGLSAQLSIPDAETTDPYIVSFSYSASADTYKEPFLILGIRIFFSGPTPAPTEDVSKPLLHEALKYLKTQLQTLSQALCISTLPCPDTF